MTAQRLRQTAFIFGRLRRTTQGILAAAVSACLLACTSSARHREPAVSAEVGFIDIGGDIKLRRMVVRSTAAKGTVLFLHGFPETLYVWKDISLALGADVEVHAFDWPGYGLSSRPPVDRFSYSPRDYADVLRRYLAKSGIDRSRLVIYATDIGALPALLLAIDDPAIAKLIVVGDFAPFDRPQFMYPSLQSLKSRPSSDETRAYMNRTGDEILENAYRRGLPKHSQFDLPLELKADLARGWLHEGMTAADAFYHYYSHFTRDQHHFESNLGRLSTPVEVIWGEQDIYISTGMAIEFAEKAHAPLRILPGTGHYPHLQRPRQTVEEVRALFGR